MKSELNICASLLELFQVVTDVTATDIKNLKIHKSQNYALGNIYAFDYNSKHYYAVEDYSLSDNPKYVQNILLDINHLLKGSILKNSSTKTDGTKYVGTLNGIEYYLWESSLN